MTEISFLAAFLAGVVALFAPCCISYLFPAYMGNIFKEKQKVIFMTFIYSLGIFSIMLPIVLGASFLSSFFMKFHDTTYIIGGSFMIIVSFITLIGIKMPVPHLAVRQKKNPDIISTYTLGLISGVTSACCAPVLIGVMTLSSLSLSLINSVLVGISFVLGMVSPLYLSALFIDKVNILKQPILKKNIYQLNIGKKSYPIFLSNIIGFATFFLTGITIMFLASTGKLSMGEAEIELTKQINQVALKITNFTDKYPIINAIFIIIVISLLAFIYKKLKKETTVNKNQDCCKQP